MAGHGEARLGTAVFKVDDETALLAIIITSAVFMILVAAYLFLNDIRPVTSQMARP